MPKFAVGDDRHHGPKPRTLTDHELETIRGVAARGTRPQDLHRAVFCSRDLFNELKLRQPELVEAIEAGAARFHDSLLGGVVRTAIDETVDARVRLDALRFLLASRFSYRDRGAETSVNIGLSGKDGTPQLTLVLETLPAEAIAAAKAAASDPMMEGAEVAGAGPRVVRRRPPVDSTATRVEPSLSLGRAWGDPDGDEPTTTVVHVRRDDVSRR